MYFCSMSHPAEKAASLLKSKGIDDVRTAVILGTGLHQLVNKIDIKVTVPYADIPGFVVSTVESHPGRLIFGSVDGIHVLAFQGRFHRYEGYEYDQIVFPVRMMKELGIDTLLVSNAAGSMNPEFKKGELMCISDHINMQGFNGDEIKNQGSLYDDDLIDLFLFIADKENIQVHKGVYVAVTGPMLETRAEYRMLGNLADAVGMSTVPEVTEAYRNNIRCLAVSVLTDECDPDNLKPVTLDEIIATANASDAMLTNLFTQLIRLC